MLTTEEIVLCTALRKFRLAGGTLKRVMELWKLSEEKEAEYKHVSFLASNKPRPQGNAARIAREGVFDTLYRGRKLGDYTFGDMIRAACDATEEARIANALLKFVTTMHDREIKESELLRTLVSPSDLRAIIRRETVVKKESNHVSL